LKACSPCREYGPIVAMRTFVFLAKASNSASSRLQISMPVKRVSWMSNVPRHVAEPGG
jgi:hypothetical protein